MSKFKNVFLAKGDVKKALADFTAAWSSDYLKVDDENSKQVAIARAMKAQEKIARSAIPLVYLSGDRRKRCTGKVGGEFRGGEGVCDRP